MAICGVLDVRFLRVIILGTAFMFLFSAFQTVSMAEESILDGARRESNGTFHGDGYTSLATVYAVFAVSNWAAPSIVSILGPILSMVLGAICYFLFVISFLKPMTATLYIASVLVGVGAAVIWTAQGNYLTINSDSTTISRNSGVFWALLQMSLFLGNMYVYFKFGGEVIITAATRTTLFIVLSSAAVAGIVFFLILICIRVSDEDFITINPRRKSESNTDSMTESLISTASSSTNVDTSSPENSVPAGPLEAFKNSIHLMGTPNMLLLSITFAYTGFELTFFSGVYGTMAGHTQAFGVDAKRYIGLIGIFIGVGEVLGGAVFGLLGSRTVKYGREPIVFFGFFVHMLCFYLAFLYYPEDSPLRETFGETYVTPNEYVAVVVGFLLGLGDSSYNTQIFSILGDAYKKDSAPAFALFKFIQSLAAAAGFFYSTHLLLPWQLLILVITNFMAVLAFFVVEWRTTRRRDYSVL